MAETKLLIKIPEAAERLSLSRSRAYQLAQAGELPGLVRIGKALRVNVKSLEAFADREVLPKSAA